MLNLSQDEEDDEVDDVKPPKRSLRSRDSPSRSRGDGGKFLLIYFYLIYLFDISLIDLPESSNMKAHQSSDDVSMILKFSI
jgi:hypothetical protein